MQWGPGACAYPITKYRQRCLPPNANLHRTQHRKDLSTGTADGPHKELGGWIPGPVCLGCFFQRDIGFDGRYELEYETEKAGMVHTFGHKLHLRNRVKIQRSGKHKQIYMFRVWTHPLNHYRVCQKSGVQENPGLTHQIARLSWFSENTSFPREPTQ